MYHFSSLKDYLPTAKVGDHIWFPNSKYSRSLRANDKFDSFLILIINEDNSLELMPFHKHKSITVSVNEWHLPVDVCNNREFKNISSYSHDIKYGRIKPPNTIIRNNPKRYFNYEMAGYISPKKDNHQSKK